MRRRPALIAIGALVVLAAAYYLLIRDSTVEAHVEVPRLAATIGSGEDAIPVTVSGAVVRWLPIPADPPLPVLPISEAPKGGRLAGPALQQVRILGAVPPALSPYVAGSYYGESGVDVELTSGIELRFGDASQAQQKWKAAAAVLADPTITALDYVDLHAPGHPAYGGAGHELPAVE